MADEAAESDLKLDKPELVEQLCHAGNELNTDMASDRELKQAQRDTVNIFLQYHFSSTQQPSAVAQSQCTGTTNHKACTPIKCKSRETHPKAVHSVRGEKRTNDVVAPSSTAQTADGVCANNPPLATSTPAAKQCVENEYVIISEDDVHERACHNNSSASLSCSPLKNNDVNTNNASNSTRPHSLFLDVKKPKYKRGNSSGSSGKTTPAQDPPLFSPSTVTSELVQSYPPSASNGHWIHSANKGAIRVVEVQSRCQAIAQLNTSPVQCRGNPQKVLARKIADRLKTIGDQMEHSEKVEGLLNYLQEMASSSYQNLYSWGGVLELFSILSRLLQQLVLIFPPGVTPYEEDERWTRFNKLWDLLIHQVTPWISRQTGGWYDFLRSTDYLLSSSHSSRHGYRGLGDRHSSEILSSPFIPQCQMQTVTPHTSEEWTHTPKLPRARRSAQVAPRLCKSYTSPEFGRSRVWSWSENGNMERERDAYPSETCVEFVEDDVDSPLTDQPGSKDEEEDMVFNSDDVDQDGDINQATCSPYLVNSPHPNSSSQAESTHDYHLDSGIHSSIENLSLSLSPQHVVQFSIGDNTSLAQQQRHHTSCTSLGSFCSLDPGSVDSSRKNSITSQPGGRRGSINKPHLHKAGSLRRSDAEISNERTPTRPHSAGNGLSNRSSGASHVGSEFMYTVGVGVSAGVSAAFIYKKVSSFLNK